MNSNTLKIDLQTISPEQCSLKQLLTGTPLEGIVPSLNISLSSADWRVEIETEYKHAFGLGERFNGVNQKDRTVSVHVLEKFCNQGETSYCPIPFAFTDSGFGIFADTTVVTEFVFETARICIRGKRHTDKTLPVLYLLWGTPQEIIPAYSRLTGKVPLPPKWAFGPWISANRWNTVAHVKEQLGFIEKHQFPTTALVLEAWSDETTFYIWNGASYPTSDGDRLFKANEFTFDSQWENPKQMIDTLHDKEIKLILWQVPVLKVLDQGVVCPQHENDRRYAIEHNLCVKNADGTPYTIPEGHWFSGGILPDFTNPETVDWWCGKRQYLLEMGVDGFKTDGGEFIYTDDARFYDGTTSTEMKNGYAKGYIKTYSDFIGDKRVLFSRAGFSGQHACPLQWAGDQESTWDELRAIFSAGLSAGLSGIVFWGFDIAGFAGALPSVELYERSTQLGVFCPIMQWHSEPAYGQFAEIMPAAGGINDRSPWNIAAFHGDKALIERLCFHYNLRMNLLPYLYMQARNCAQSGLPMMRHLAVNYPQDKAACAVEDEFMLGDLLIAPVLHEGATYRRVYLPDGAWMELFTQIEYAGGNSYEIACNQERIPVFAKIGCAIALNLDDSLTLGSPVGNVTTGYKNLCVLLCGPCGESHFVDELGNDFTVQWNGTNATCTGNCRTTVNPIFLHPKQQVNKQA